MDADRFQWDDGNRWKLERRFDVEVVEGVFEDEDAIPRPAYRSGNERRFALIGATGDDQALFVVYTWRGARIRVISARAAEPHEQRDYWLRRSKER